MVNGGMAHARFAFPVALDEVSGGEGASRGRCFRFLLVNLWGLFRGYEEEKNFSFSFLVPDSLGISRLEGMMPEKQSSKKKDGS